MSATDEKTPTETTDGDGPSGLERIMADRVRKAERLRELGANPYRNDFQPDSTAAELHGRFAEQGPEALEALDPAPRFAVAGRLTALRSFGKAAFLRIEDRSPETLQLFLRKDVLGAETFKLLKACDMGDLVGAIGRPMRTRTGELSIEAEQFVVLTKAIRPMPEKFHGLTDTETRYRRRYVDLLSTSETRERFRQRSAIVTAVRAFFDSRDYLEVETPMMHAIAGGAAARPFVTHHNALDTDLYLRIAPELYLKRLLVGGLERVYEIGRNFRNEGLSTQHNPEFTMLEAYGAYNTYLEAMELVEQLFAHVARQVCGGTTVQWQGATIELEPPFERLPLRQALVQRAGVPAEQVDDLAALKAFAQGLLADPGVHEPDKASELWSKIEDLDDLGKAQLEVFESLIEHTLIQPTFVIDYPVSVSPLSRRKESDPTLVDRFELFVGGRELANAFSELNDPADQRRRFAAQVEARRQGDDEAMPYDEDYCEALEHGMPPAAGLGVGIDRLVMLLTNQSSIRDVILFPTLRPVSDQG